MRKKATNVDRKFYKLFKRPLKVSWNVFTLISAIQKQCRVLRRILLCRDVLLWTCFFSVPSQLPKELTWYILPTQLGHFQAILATLDHVREMGDASPVKMMVGIMRSPSLGIMRTLAGVLLEGLDE